MTHQPRVHLTIAFDESDLPAVAGSRRRWDPEMAERVPPHVTLAYPEEFDDEGLLIDRAAAAAERFGPFSIRVAEVFVEDHGRGGVFCAVVDPTQSWSGLRASLLRPPFRPLEVSPHVTLVHPRTSVQGIAAWAELEDWEFDCLVVVREFSLTSTDRLSGMTARRRFPLTGRGRQLCAAMVLVDEDRGLLARRTADRTWYPGVWDLVGGRVGQSESLLSAACREAGEELGIAVNPTDAHYVETLVTDDAEVVVFATRTWTGTPRNAESNEHDEIRWFDPIAVSHVELSHPSLPNVVRASCSKML